MLINFYKSFGSHSYINSYERVSCTTAADRSGNYQTLVYASSCIMNDGVSKGFSQSWVVERDEILSKRAFSEEGNGNTIRCLS